VWLIWLKQQVCEDNCWSVVIISLMKVYDCCCCAGGCHRSSQNDDLKFIRSHKNSQWWVPHVSLVIDVPAMTEWHLAVHETFCYEMKIYHLRVTFVSYVCCIRCTLIFTSCILKLFLSSKFTHFRGFFDPLMVKSEEIINSWPVFCSQHCTLWIICVISGVHLAFKI
jgi:hypothetical protein